MKIFGLNITKDKAESAKFAESVHITDIAIPANEDDSEVETQDIQEIAKVHSPALVFQHFGMRATKPTQKRHFFEQAEYDLYEIERICDVDSYVRQAFKKKVGLFLKEGFDYIGPNKKVVDYVKARFAQIERATGIPHNEFIRRLATQFIKKSNAFLIKVRKRDASGGKVRTDANGRTLEPIAGYFPVPPETMQIKGDGSGEPYKWRQSLPNGVHLYFDPKDVVHFTYDKKEGFLFGTPTLVPVIDDIRALRTIEQNLELLVYKHLFPLFHFKVGTPESPAGITEDGQREIDVFRHELQNMPTEGGIVTSERFEVDSIGSESKALRAEAYLEHFKRRVFAGLGMSAVDYGEGDTSNKSTSDNMSRALIDDVKDYQEAFEAQFNVLIINELLLEANFTDDVLSPEFKVELYFREIDIDKQIKVENHSVDIFLKDAITWDELRAELGKDPIRIPDDPEQQDPSQYKQWFNTSWKLFREPEKMIAAKGDSLYSPFITALANHPSSSLTSENVTGNQKASEEQEIAAIKAKPVPKPAVKKKDSFLKTDYEAMEEAVVVETNKLSVKLDYVKQKLTMVSKNMEDKLRSSMNAAFLDGVGGYSYLIPEKISVARNEISMRAHIIINRLRSDIESSFIQKVDMHSTNDKILSVRAIFDAFRYRINFITDTETVRAKNLGLIYRAIESGAVKAKVDIKLDTCNNCKDKSINTMHLETYTLNTVPPHHPNCSCGLVVTEVRT